MNLNTAMTRLTTNAVTRFAAIAGACLAAACGSGAPTPDDAGVTTTPAAERLAGTPEGGLRSWVQDIREGTSDLGDRFTQDAKAAEKTAVDLYVNRQEWLERYWGTYGLLAQNGAPELGQSVMDAEARFHELLTILTSSDATAERVRQSVLTLHAQLETVLSHAETASVPLVPPDEATTPDNQK